LVSYLNNKIRFKEKIIISINREMVQRLRINQFYAAPTALRLLLRYDSDHVTKYDRSSLKVLGSVGEPINTEAWHWYHDLVGEKRCKIADTWWQTETGGACITPLPSAKGAIIKPAIAMVSIYFKCLSDLYESF
jgi:acetyl-CoA synthetase